MHIILKAIACIDTQTNGTDDTFQNTPKYA